MNNHFKKILVVIVTGFLGTSLFCSSANAETNASNCTECIEQNSNKVDTNNDARNNNAEVKNKSKAKMSGSNGVVIYREISCGNGDTKNNTIEPKKGRGGSQKDEQLITEESFVEKCSFKFTLM